MDAQMGQYCVNNENALEITQRMPLVGKTVQRRAIRWMWGDTDAHKGLPYYTPMRATHAVSRRV